MLFQERKRSVWQVLLMVTVASTMILGVTSLHPSRANASGGIILVNFDVPVDPGASSLVANAVSMAESENASAIVIEMNTPGGYLSDMVTIIDSIQQANKSGIPTYTYVPPDALAASAGSYIAMATNSIIMGAGSELGPSTPIVEGGTALEQNHTEDAMIQLMVSLAQSWGRNTTAAYNMVYSDTAYSSQDALGVGLIEGSASSLSGALAQWGLTGSTTTVGETFYDQLLSALSNSTLDGILILVGVIAITLDLFHPTFFLSAAGAVAMVAGLVGAEIVGDSTLGLVIIACGGALILLELKSGHGLAMMGGVVVGAVGIFLLSQGVQFSPSPINGVTTIEISAIAAVGILAGLYVRWVVGPMRMHRSVTGPEALIGKVATVLSPLSPEGEVSLEGIRWGARSTSGSTAAGEKVIVRSVDGLELRVERVETQ